MTLISLLGGSSLLLAGGSLYYSRAYTLNKQLFQKTKQAITYDFDYLQNHSDMAQKEVAFCTSVESLDFLKKHKKILFKDSETSYEQISEVFSVKAVGQDKWLGMELKHPRLFNVQNSAEKLVFMGKLEGEIFEAEYVLGENKEIFMKFLDDQMNDQWQKIIGLIMGAIVLQQSINVILYFEQRDKPLPEGIQ